MLYLAGHPPPRDPQHPPSALPPAGLPYAASPAVPPGPFSAIPISAVFFALSRTSRSSIWAAYDRLFSPPVNTPRLSLCCSTTSPTSTRTSVHFLHLHSLPKPLLRRNETDPRASTALPRQVPRSPSLPLPRRRHPRPALRIRTCSGLPRNRASRLFTSPHTAQPIAVPLTIACSCGSAGRLRSRFSREYDSS